MKINTLLECVEVFNTFDPNDENNSAAFSAAESYLNYSYAKYVDYCLDEGYDALSLEDYLTNVLNLDEGVLGNVLMNMRAAGRTMGQMWQNRGNNQFTGGELTQASGTDANGNTVYYGPNGQAMNSPMGGLGGAWNQFKAGYRDNRADIRDNAFANGLGAKVGYWFNKLRYGTNQANDLADQRQMNYQYELPSNQAQINKLHNINQPEQTQQAPQPQNNFNNAASNFFMQNGQATPAPKQQPQTQKGAGGVEIVQAQHDADTIHSNNDWGVNNNIAGTGFQIKQNNQQGNNNQQSQGTKENPKKIKELDGKVNDKTKAAYANAQGEFADKSYNKAELNKNITFEIPDPENPGKMKKVTHTMGQILTDPNLEKQYQSANLRTAQNNLLPEMGSDSKEVQKYKKTQAKAEKSRNYYTGGTYDNGQSKPQEITTDKSKQYQGKNSVYTSNGSERQGRKHGDRRSIMGDNGVPKQQIWDTTIYDDKTGKPGVWRTMAEDYFWFERIPVELRKSFLQFNEIYANEYFVSHGVMYRVNEFGNDWNKLDENKAFLEELKDSNDSILNSFIKTHYTRQDLSSKVITNESILNEAFKWDVINESEYNELLNKYEYKGTFSLSESIASNWFNASNRNTPLTPSMRMPSGFKY